MTRMAAARWLLLLVLVAGTLRADPRYDLRYSVVIDQPAADVWNALTKPEKAMKYGVLSLDTFAGVPCGRITFSENSPYGSGGVIQSLRAPYSLVHTFRFAGLADAETLVSYEIRPLSAKKCELTITQTGFPLKNRTHDRMRRVWPDDLKALKQYVETGRSPYFWPHVIDVILTVLTFFIAASLAVWAGAVIMSAPNNTYLAALKYTAFVFVLQLVFAGTLFLAAKLKIDPVVIAFTIPVFGLFIYLVVSFVAATRIFEVNWLRALVMMIITRFFMELFQRGFHVFVEWLHWILEMFFGGL